MLRLLPPVQRVRYESWTLLRYHRDSPRYTEQDCDLISLDPNRHFINAELAVLHETARREHRLSRHGWKPQRDYYTDLERRLRRLDTRVQVEIYKLIRNRNRSTNSYFRKWNWKIAILIKVPSAEITIISINIKERFS